MKRLFVGLMVLALSVAVASAEAAQKKSSAGKAMTASGMVTAVSGSSMTIKSGAKDMTFTIDNATKFVGKGLGTKASKGPIMATDAVAMNDRVSVTYHDMGGGTMHAAQVRVMSKAGAKK